MAKTIKIKLEEKYQNKLAELYLYYITNYGIKAKDLNQALMEYVIDTHHENVKDQILYKKRIIKKIAH